MDQQFIGGRAGAHRRHNGVGYACPGMTIPGMLDPPLLHTRDMAVSISCSEPKL
jgi:hypothetical protein